VQAPAASSGTLSLSKCRWDVVGNAAKARKKFRELTEKNENVCDNFVENELEEK
jgi:hypothetical protein